MGSLPSCVANPSRGIFTLLELSNDAKFVEILVKTTENTIRYSKPPRRSHDRVQPPLPYCSIENVWGMATKVSVYKYCAHVLVRSRK